MSNEMTLPAKLIDTTMKENFIKNAKEKPWGWEWKYTMAYLMLRKGRPIKHVKDTLQLTYQWLLRHKLIEYNAKGILAVVAQ